MKNTKKTKKKKEYAMVKSKKVSSPRSKVLVALTFCGIPRSKLSEILGPFASERVILRTK